MGTRDMWKMLHLLHTKGPSLSRTKLRKAGIDCDSDTIQPLITSKAVEHFPADVPYEKAEEYRITDPAVGIIQNCLVANRREIFGIDMRVDEPQVFVIMPFSEKWSSQVYSKMIEPAVVEPGEIEPDAVMTPGIFVKRIVQGARYEKRIERRTVRRA